MSHLVNRQIKLAGTRRLAAISRSLMLTGGLLSTLCLTARAAEPAYAPLLAYNSVSKASTFDAFESTRAQRAEPKRSFSTSEAPQFSTRLTLNSEKFTLDDSIEPRAGERYFGDLSRVRSSGLLDEGSVVLFRTRLASRFSYRSWAGLHSGYGQIFNSPDTIGRSRTNGAGIDDPSCLYLKMSLNF